MNVKSPKTILAALLLTTQVEASNVINERPQQVVQPVAMNTVNFVDHKLNAWIKNRHIVNISVDSAGMSPFNGFNQQAWAVFRNHTNYEYVLEVRAQFYDADGVMLPDITKWQRVFVPANAMARYAQVSIDDRTSQFRLEARSAK